jgi:hypothetical protein
MIYDPNTQLWAVTYTHGNTNYSGDPNVASGIGLITIDQSLNLFLRKFYWHSEGLENYGVSIALSDSRDYVIGCFVYEDFPLQKRNPALLKVDNAGNPIFFMRYNIDDDVIFGHHCKSYNPGTGDEEYVLVAEHSNDLRAIRTDVNGDACGAVRYKPFVLDFDEEEEVFKYYPEEVGEFHDYKPSVEEIDPEYRKCSGNASSYREAALTGVSTQEESTTGVHIYPTILSTANPVLTFQNKSGAVYSVKVMDVSGKVILEETTIGKGKNTLKLDKNEALTTGIYLVQFYSADGRVSGSKKIILTH